MKEEQDQTQIPIERNLDNTKMRYDEAGNPWTGATNTSTQPQATAEPETKPTSSVYVPPSLLKQEAVSEIFIFISSILSHLF